MSAQQIKDFFNRRAEGWDKDTPSDPKKIKQIIRMCDLDAGQKVLDAACGTGVLFPRLLDHCPVQLLGVDISEAMVEKAQSKHKDERLDVVAKDFLQLSAKGFDRIIFYNAYPHFFDKASLAEKIFEVLAPGGRFVVAHSQGKEHINAMHHRKKACAYSVPLKSADIERQWFEPWFRLDKHIDTDEMFVLSGTKA